MPKSLDLRKKIVEAHKAEGLLSQRVKKWRERYHQEIQRATRYRTSLAEVGTKDDKDSGLMRDVFKDPRTPAKTQVIDLTKKNFCRRDAFKPA